MFKIFKNRESKIVSPATGIIKDISKVNDETFASKCLGEGFAVEPSSGVVVSPIDGSIEAIFPTKHALVIKSKDEKNILIHIGVDSVQLEGEGFNLLVEEKQKVKAGQKIVEVDLDMIKSKIPSSDIMVIFTDGDSFNLIEKERSIKVGEKI